jgi:hypothetical protein
MKWQSTTSDAAYVLNVLDVKLVVTFNWKIFLGFERRRKWMIVHRYSIINSPNKTFTPNKNDPRKLCQYPCSPIQELESNALNSSKRVRPTCSYVRSTQDVAVHHTQ